MLLTSFNKVLSCIFPFPSTVKAIAFGSFVSSTYSPTSDIDLALDGEIIGAQLRQLEPVEGEGGGKLKPCEVDPLQMIPMVRPRPSGFGQPSACPWCQSLCRMWFLASIQLVSMTNFCIKSSLQRSGDEWGPGSHQACSTVDRA